MRKEEENYMYLQTAIAYTENTKESKENLLKIVNDF